MVSEQQERLGRQVHQVLQELTASLEPQVRPAQSVLVVSLVPLDLRARPGRWVCQGLVAPVVQVVPSVARVTLDPWEVLGPRVPLGHRERLEARATLEALVQLEVLDSQAPQELVVSRDPEVVLELLDLWEQLVIEALVEVQVLLDLLESMVRLETRVRLDSLDQWAAPVQLALEDKPESLGCLALLGSSGLLARLDPEVPQEQLVRQGQ